MKFLGLSWAFYDYFYTQQVDWMFFLIGGLMCTFNFDLSGGTEDRNLPANMGDTDLIPGPGRFHMPWSK